MRPLLGLDGVDRAGKSTQAKKLMSYLQANRNTLIGKRSHNSGNGGSNSNGGSRNGGMDNDQDLHPTTTTDNAHSGVVLSGDVELWRFPDRSTHIGRTINGYLQGSESHDLSDAAVHLLFSANRWERCSALLEKLNSGTTLIVDRYAYSGAAFTAAKGVTGLDLEWCKAPDVGLPAPDCTFFLNMPVEDAASRGGMHTLYMFCSLLLYITIMFLKKMFLHFPSNHSHVALIFAGTCTGFIGLFLN